MCLRHVPLKNLDFVGSGIARRHLRVGVGGLHRGIGKTKQNASKEVVYSRENCGVVDRR